MGLPGCRSAGFYRPASGLCLRCSNQKAHMESEGNGHEVGLLRLRRALDAERAYLQSYERPSEPIVYETLRTLDDLFCRDLMEPQRTVSNAEHVSRSLS